MRPLLALAVLVALLGTAAATFGDNGLTTFTGRKRQPNTLVFGNDMVTEQALQATLNFAKDVLKGTWRPVKNDPPTPKQEVYLECLNSVAPEPLNWKMWCPGSDAKVVGWQDKSGAAHRQITLRPQKDMTSTMYQWFITTTVLGLMPPIVEFQGNHYHYYHLWHPLDHVESTWSLGPKLPILQKGPPIYVLIHERYRNPANFTYDRHYETNGWFYVENAPVNLMKNRYVITMPYMGIPTWTMILEFNDTPEGLVVDVEVIAGVPFKGYDERAPKDGYRMAAGMNELFTAPLLARQKGSFDWDESINAISRHVIEEFSNLQHFVPYLYEKCTLLGKVGLNWIPNLGTWLQHNYHLQPDSTSISFYYTLEKLATWQVNKTGTFHEKVIDTQIDILNKTFMAGAKALTAVNEHLSRKTFVPISNTLTKISLDKARAHGAHPEVDVTVASKRRAAWSKLLNNSEVSREAIVVGAGGPHKVAVATASTSSAAAADSSNADQQQPKPKAHRKGKKKQPSQQGEGDPQAQQQSQAKKQQAEQDGQPAQQKKHRKGHKKQPTQGAVDGKAAAQQQGATGQQAGAVDKDGQPAQQPKKHRKGHKTQPSQGGADGQPEQQGSKDGAASDQTLQQKAQGKDGQPAKKHGKGHKKTPSPGSKEEQPALEQKSPGGKQQLAAKKQQPQPEPKAAKKVDPKAPEAEDDQEEEEEGDGDEEDGDSQAADTAEEEEEEEEANGEAKTEEGEEDTADADAAAETQGGSAGEGDGEEEEDDEDEEGGGGPSAEEIANNPALKLRQQMNEEWHEPDWATKDDEDPEEEKPETVDVEDVRDGMAEMFTEAASAAYMDATLPPHPIKSGVVAAAILADQLMLSGIEPPTSKTHNGSGAGSDADAAIEVPSFSLGDIRAAVRASSSAKNVSGMILDIKQDVLAAVINRTIPFHADNNTLHVPEPLLAALAAKHALHRGVLTTLLNKTDFGLGNVSFHVAPASEAYPGANAGAEPSGPLLDLATKKALLKGGTLSSLLLNGTGLQGHTGNVSIQRVPHEVFELLAHINNTQNGSGYDATNGTESKPKLKTSLKRLGASVKRAKRLSKSFKPSLSIRAANSSAGGGGNGTLSEKELKLQMKFWDQQRLQQ